MINLQAFERRALLVIRHEVPPGEPSRVSGRVSPLLTRLDSPDGGSRQIQCGSRLSGSREASPQLHFRLQPEFEITVGRTACFFPQLMG